MKVQKLGIGKQIEVGDVILHDSWTGKTWHKVIRVTSKFAVIRWNDVAEGKFPRVIPICAVRPRISVGASDQVPSE